MLVVIIHKDSENCENLASKIHTNTLSYGFIELVKLLVKNFFSIIRCFVLLPNQDNIYFDSIMAMSINLARIVSLNSFITSFRS